MQVVERQDETFNREVMMNRIAQSLNHLKDHYDVIVVGSGYGGGIAASRMARAGRKVCVLERGREFLPGEFPDTLSESSAETQYQTKKGRIGNETGLFDFHTDDDINVLVGCGLGGTSLINANVVIQADPRVFDDPVWPNALVENLPHGFAKGYTLVRTMLRANPYPEGQTDYPPLPKTSAMKAGAEALAEPFVLPDLAVTFDQHEHDINHVGVKQTPCVNCGDCFSGCNHSAKNTVHMNYLPDAFNHGADIFTEARVQYVEYQGGQWRVHFKALGSGRSFFDADDPFVSADIVILAAGTLGTTEILLRSGQKGLTHSRRLGTRFTGNGDVLAFAYNNDRIIDGIGWGSREPDPKRPVGPTITGLIDTRKNAVDYKQGMSIEEGAIPGILASVLPLSFNTLSRLIGRDTDEGFWDYVDEKRRQLSSMVRGAYHGAVRNTLTFLVMTHDSADGVLKLENNRLRIHWPNVGKEEIFKHVEARLIEVTKALGGCYLPNPMWSNRSIYADMFGNDLITVHPLGGCAMGENASDGVCNHKGQVFSGESGIKVHEGLYVADGAIIPTSLGTNPLLTIAALAERNMALLAQDRGWTLSYDLPSQRTAPLAPTKPGIQFTETMAGFFSTRETENYEEAAEKGKSEGSELSFTLTIRSDDVEQMLRDQNHEATMFGTVQAGALSPEVLAVHEGIFNLFVLDPDQPGTRRMRYRMKLVSQAGKTFYFEGFKVIKDEAGLDLWADTTTLYITVYDGVDASAPVLGKGIITIRPIDFARQMTTMKVTHTDDPARRLKILAEFGRFFAGTLFETYGGIFSGLSYFTPDAAARKRRPLRTPAPEVHPFKTEDGIQLRLTRFKGGPKGPVILSHGLGVSSRIFSTDTIDTNLLEYLVAHQFDVWLLDYRASIALPAAEAPFTGDDIAQYDYPAAVDKVRHITKADSVQMVVHCFGATTWTMSMLSGRLKGVRLAVVSQVSTHAKPPLLTKLKTGLHIPSFLNALGVDSLTAYVDTNSNWTEKLLDQAMKVYPIQPEERCRSAVCHRITFLYGHLYEHDQLNTETHRCLHEMFGLANIQAFEHLALICRQGHIVDAKGKDVYLAHLERLAIPITFLSGAENECFLPESTEITYNLLKEQNGQDLYRRYVIPHYGHIDCIFGKDAAADVYPLILKQLEMEGR